MRVERTHRNVLDDSSGKARTLRCGILIRSCQKTPGGLKHSSLLGELGAVDSDTSLNSASASSSGTNNSRLQNFFFKTSNHGYGYSLSVKASFRRAGG